MRKRNTIRLEVLLAGWALLGLPGLLGVLAFPEATVAQAPTPGAALQPGQERVRPVCSDCTVVREIDDPSTGKHWLLMRDPARPGGPGVLVAEATLPDRSWLEDAIVKLHPVIRAGERLIVEQSSAKSDIRLEGIALSPAAAGGTVLVRLQLSGKVVPTVVLGPGRAALVAEKGLWQ